MNQFKSRWITPATEVAENQGIKSSKNNPKASFATFDTSNATASSRQKTSGQTPRRYEAISVKQLRLAKLYSAGTLMQVPEDKLRKLAELEQMIDELYLSANNDTFQIALEFWESYKSELFEVHKVRQANGQRILNSLK